MEEEILGMNRIVFFILFLAAYFIVPIIIVSITNLIYYFYQIKIKKITQRSNLRDFFSTSDENYIMILLLWPVIFIYLFFYGFYQLVTEVPRDLLENYFRRQIQFNSERGKIDQLEDNLVSAALDNNENMVAYYAKLLSELNDTIEKLENTKI